MITKIKEKIERLNEELEKLNRLATSYFDHENHLETLKKLQEHYDISGGKMNCQFLTDGRKQTLEAMAKIEKRIELI